MKKILLPALLIVSTTLSAQEFDRQKMDSLFNRIVSSDRGMGSISIFEDGDEKYQRTFGWASIEDSVKADRQTTYRIGSISKTFTAAIIMGLIEEDRLRPETTLADFYPEVKNSEKITIEQMLKHRSGIFNFTSATDYQSWMEQPITREDLVKKIVANGSAFQPGEKAEYSNANYVLLSLIAERIEDKPFEQIVQKTLCEPCSLENTYYGKAISVKDNEAKSYRKLGDWQIATETDMSVPLGAGALVANPTDLNRFLHCLFNHEIVSEETLETMMEIEDGYGMGMFQIPFYEKKAYGHTGGIDGFQSNAGYFPREKVSVAYTSNGVVMPMNDILIGVLSIYFGRAYELPEFVEALTLTSEELDKYLGVYSSPSFPLKVTISKEENTLLAQATGQPSFALEAYETDKFKFDQALLKLEFIPEDNAMILKQGGKEYELKRE